MSANVDPAGSPPVYWWWLPSASGSDEPRQRRRNLWGLLLVMAIGLAVGLIGIATPAPSPDEAATVMAVRRSWPDMFVLFSGQDAPLMAYYALAKTWVAVFGWLPTLIALRVLSVAAMALAAGFLYLFATRHIGILGGVLASVLFTALPGVSRFAQEARPSAVLVAASGFAWLMWLTWQRPDRRPRGRGWLTEIRQAVGYFAGLTGAALVSLFGFLQWPAQVLADLTSSGLSWRRRVQRAAQSVVVMAAALLVTAPVTVTAVFRGAGPTSESRVGLATLWSNFARVLTVHSSTCGWLLVAGLLLAAAVAGLTVVVGGRHGLGERYRTVVRIAAIWFAVPLLGAIAIAMLRPNLLRRRYWLPMVPPLALLAAVGILIVAELVYWWVLRRSGKRRPRAAAVAAAVAVVLPLAMVAGLTAPAHRELRRHDGHETNVKKLFAQLDALLAEDPEIPIVVTPPSRAIVMMVMRPELTARNVLMRLDQDAVLIWPARTGKPEVTAALEGEDTVIWVHSTYRSPKRPKAPPKELDGFRIAEIDRVATWWLVRLER